MCGICGFIHKKTSSVKVLDSMNQTISYRGPNDEGIYLDNINGGYQIGLAHKRLSILDLSESGHQPMKSNDESVIVVFNGEIYNYQEIKNELLIKGYNFKSTSDTEVIIYAYKEWGIDSVKKFNGMFSIALFDKVKDEFYLIRDRVGIKPLYYYYNGQDLVFGSELKPIMKYPYFHKDINFHALNMYLFHQYITAPHTIFDKTYKLEPGTYLRFKNGDIEHNVYWSIENVYRNRKVERDYTEQQYVEQLEEILLDSVKLRMISDVPIGAFLSGGIDSSLVVALMQKLSSQPIRTFTIGFDVKKYNEATYAKEIAKHLGTNHNELYLPLNRAKDLIEDIPLYYDEPFADSSQLPTMLVSQLAKKHVTVSLSGDGGDELFCGYKIYDIILSLQRFKSISKLINIGDNILDIGHIVSKLNTKLAHLMNVNSDENIINTNYKTSKYYLDQLTKHPFRIEEKYYSILDISDNIQEKRMLQDIITYLPDDILTKVDRASMSVSLEARTPILDHRVLEFSMNCPHTLKYHNGNKKYILKEVLFRYVPRELMERPKKGFSVPIYDWLRNELNDYIIKYFDESFIKRQGIFNYKQLNFILKKFYKERNNYFARIIWSIIVFQMWHERYM